jgi:hypothetical protein
MFISGSLVDHGSDDVILALPRELTGRYSVKSLGRKALPKRRAVN